VHHCRWHFCFLFCLTSEKNTTAESFWTPVCHIVGGRDRTTAVLQRRYSALGRATRPPEIHFASCAGEDADADNRGRFVQYDDGAGRPL